MSTVLKNGIIIPDNGSRNWGGDLANNWNIIDVNVGYMNDVKTKVTTLENSVAENTANIQINASNISALQTSKQDVIEDLETIRTGATAGATAVQPSALNDYYTKTEIEPKLDSKATDADVVHKSGNEIINGVKDFNDVFLGEQRGVIRLGDNDEGKRFCTLYYDGRIYNNSKQFIPSANNEFNLGTSSKKWKTLNGVNPGALSLPSDASISIDTTTFEWNKNFTFTPSIDGYLFISFGSSDGIRKLSVKTGRGEYYITNQKGLLRYTFSVYKDKIVTILVSSSITESVMPAMTLFTCQGNV